MLGLFSLLLLLHHHAFAYATLSGRLNAHIKRDSRGVPQQLSSGRFYAINVDATVGSTGQDQLAATRFKLVPLDVNHTPELLSGQSTASREQLTRRLRYAYPNANVGWAWYGDTYTEDGWYRLELRIDSDAPFPDIVKARAAGFVEGNLQGQHMYRYWSNYKANEYAGRGGEPSRELLSWLEAQHGWAVGRAEAATGLTLSRPPGHGGAGQAYGNTAAAASTAGGSAAEGAAGAAAGAGAGGGGGGGGNGAHLADWDRRYWATAALVLEQFAGLAAGFWASATQPDRNMTWGELYALNALGDLYELNVLFPPPPEQGGAVSEPGAEVRPRWYSPGHGEVGPYGYGELLECSAIIKLGEEEPSSGSSGSSGAEGGEQDAFGAREQDGEEGAAGEEAAASGGRGRARRGLREGREGGAGGAAGRRAGLRPRGRNFWAAHNTWRPYYAMVRTWKVYDLPWAATGPLTVSSSPGLLHSKDDWYTTDAFVIMETTNGIYNRSLYDAIRPHCLLMWQRAQIANFAARTGAEWVDMFAEHNSGTYNNQWMVLDVDRLQSAGRRRAPHATDVLWVLEQVPGAVVAADVTQVLLSQGYWASYNVPYFPEIYNLTGYPQPSIYHTCPRAQIFRREQAGVSSLADLQSLMRLNRYRDDPLSDGLPNAAIAARYDLPALPGLDAHGQPRNWTRRAYGAVDAKVVDLESFRSRTTYVVNGPTAEDQPPFAWEAADPALSGVAHEGCAPVFDFGWQAYEPVMWGARRARAGGAGALLGGEAAARAQQQAAAAERR